MTQSAQQLIGINALIYYFGTYTIGAFEHLPEATRFCLLFSV